MPIELAIATIAAGMAYVLVPGPATLAALSLSASQGRVACAKFLCAHLLGDVTWSMLAFLAIAGISRVGPELFDALGIACGIYLLWLGAKAIRARKASTTPMISDPVRAGLIFGLTNPKAYPFALAMFTALLGRFGSTTMAIAHAPGLVAMALVGFVLADVIVVAWTGLRPIRRMFERHETIITRATGAIFILFGAKSISDAIASMRART
jgi:threonine/homoserine/homoserine lactone efflux protein